MNTTTTKKTMTINEKLAALHPAQARMVGYFLAGNDENKGAIAMQAIDEQLERQTESTPEPTPEPIDDLPPIECECVGDYVCGNPGTCERQPEPTSDDAGWICGGCRTHKPAASFGDTTRCRECRMTATCEECNSDCLEGDRVCEDCVEYGYGNLQPQPTPKHCKGCGTVLGIDCGDAEPDYSGTICSVGCAVLLSRDDQLVEDDRPVAEYGVCVIKDKFAQRLCTRLVSDDGVLEYFFLDCRDGVVVAGKSRNLWARPFVVTHEVAQSQLAGMMQAGYRFA